MAHRLYQNLTTDGDTLITVAASQRSGSPFYGASVQITGDFAGATVEILKGHTGFPPVLVSSSSIAPSYTSAANFVIDDVAGVGTGTPAIAGNNPIPSADIEYYVRISGATGGTDLTVSVIDHR